MDPRTALHDPVFCRFLAVCAGLLGAGGLLLRAKAGHAWRSYRGWLIMAPTFFAAVFLGRAATIVFLSVVGGFGFKEFARATGLYGCWFMTGTAYLGITGVGIAALMGWLGLFLALPVFVVAAIFLVPVLRDCAQGQVQSMALATIGFMYVGWMFLHLAFLANAPGHAYGYLLFLVFAVELNDIAAYVFGKWLGKRPVRPTLSPNKTIAGCLGGLAVSLALPFACRFALPHFGVVELVLTGLIVGVGGQLGDLAISVVKRDLGIKDMGALIPGHGGILDRIDSLIFVAPLFFHMTHYVHGVVA